MDIEVCDYGVDGASYFPGHGTSFTDYAHCALGVGDTFAEALEDAIEQACTGVEPFDADAARAAIRERYPEFVPLGGNPERDGLDGWIADVNAHAECGVGYAYGIVCKSCNEPIAKRKGSEVWEDSEGNAQCEEGYNTVEAEHEHEPEEGWHDECELYYHVGIRWNGK